MTGIDATALRELQRPLKEKYREDPPAAVTPKLWPSLSQKFFKPHAGPTIGEPSGVYAIAPL